MSIWSTGGNLQRYVRLKDTTLRIPPLVTDQKFRVGHDAKRLYYIGEDEGKKVIVIVYLKDLSFEFKTLPDFAQGIDSFEDSSLFRNYLCFVIKERVPVK